MITNDSNILKFRHGIYEELCKIAWEKELEDSDIDKLVYKMIPGPKPDFRCCIYKEREIMRQRIRLIQDMDVNDKPADGNIVQVIDAACDECPISSYSVTDNCRFCLGRPCKANCKFDAITEGEFRMHIDNGKCKECGLCAKACPFQAIVHLERPCKRSCPVDAISYDEYGYCRIDNEKCIRCGHCIHSCPFGAISSKTNLIQVIKEIKAGKEVYAMCAPATEGQFGESINMNSIRQALKKIGFVDMIDVGLGGDLTAAFEALEWSEAKLENKKLTTSCCPAFINMIKKHFPDIYKENVSNTVSPMCAVSRLLKTMHKDCITVFIGPCIAKKSEASEMNIDGNADYVLTYGELSALLRSRGIKFEDSVEYTQEASVYGKRFANAGGVAEAVLQCMKERNEDVSNIKYERATGGAECKKALLLLKAGKLDTDFIEGMVCDGGCVGGPSRHLTEQEVFKAREKLLSQADNRKVLDNINKYPIDKFSMNKTEKYDKIK